MRRSVQAPEQAGGDRAQGRHLRSEWRDSSRCGEIAPFAVRSERAGALHRVTPVGELDLATLPTLQRELDDACLLDGPDTIIVVDLTRLSFMDSTVISLLIRMDAAIGGPAGRLRVINGSPAAERTLRLTGVRDRLPVICNDVDPLAPLSSLPAPFRGAGHPYAAKKGERMGVAMSIVMIAVGAILRFAVSVTTTGFSLHSIGLILMILGVLSLLLSIMFWSSWGGFAGGAGGGYRRQRRVTQDGAGGFVEEVRDGTA
jgi:anti-anti-sigma factor